MDTIKENNKNKTTETRSKSSSKAKKKGIMSGSSSPKETLASSKNSNKIYRSSSQFKSSGGSSYFKGDNSPLSDSVWGQSAATWRQTSLSYGFPKEQRFKSKDKQLQLTSENNIKETSEFTITLPSTITTKSCTLGRGEKQIIPQYYLKNARENPSPGHNQQPYTYSNIRNIALGSQMRFSPKKSDLLLPGPGTYNVQQPPGKDKKMFSLKSRINQTIEQRIKNQQLSPNHYNPIENLTVNKKFSKISFGKGRKVDFENKSVKGFPGPIYNLPSVFDKFQNIKKNWLSPLNNEYTEICNNSESINKKKSNHSRAYSEHINTTNKIFY